MSKRVIQEAINGLIWRIELWQTFMDDCKKRKIKEKAPELFHWYEGKIDSFETVIDSLQSLIKRIKEVEQEEKDRI